MLYVKLLVMVAFMVLSVPAYAAGAADPEMRVVDNNCWAEIFDDDNFDMSDPHVKLMGPKEYSSLQDVYGRNWNNDIESLVVGPNATVKAYSKTDFDGTEIAFLPNQRVPDLGKLDMGNEIESLKIACGHP